MLEIGIGLEDLVSEGWFAIMIEVWGFRAQAVAEFRCLWLKGLSLAVGGHGRGAFNLRISGFRLGGCRKWWACIGVSTQ